MEYIPGERGDRLPDFSRVGYYGGDKKIPDVPVWKKLAPNGINDEQIIQAAIDELSSLPPGKNGFRGAILLRKGVYKISGTLKINAGGIVLRGEGDSTILLATGKGQRNLIAVSGRGKIQEIKGSRQKITDAYVPLGAQSFTVQDAAAFKVGDSIILFRPGTQQWITDLKMDSIQVRDSSTKQWLPKEYDFHFERTITAIQGHRIFIDNPVVMAMEDKYGGGEIYHYTYAGRISDVGIERLVCRSEYNGDTDEDHGWNAVHFNRLQNGWVRNITAIHFGYSCVNLGEESRNVSVISCRYLSPKSRIEGGRRYSFNNDGQMNIVSSCYANEGRHDYVTGAKVRGPNVFLDCVSENAKADIGPHHRWAMGTLYDNIVSDGEINAQDRGNWGTGHGWSGVNQVFFNCVASRAAIQDPWVSGKNYVICMQAVPYDGRLKGRNASAWYCTDDKKLQTKSLFLAQLAQRRKQETKHKK
ncbi:MAG: hypothetical protein QM687_16670 [Ferruginibacter sp.]